MSNDVEITIKIRVPAGKDWNFRMADIIREVRDEVYINPKKALDKVESLEYSYQYSIQGQE